jgi:hypothetical protein
LLKVQFLPLQLPYYGSRNEAMSLCWRFTWNSTHHPEASGRTAVYETRTYDGVRGAVRQLLAEPSTRLVAVFFLIHRIIYKLAIYKLLKTCNFAVF